MLIRLAELRGWRLHRLPLFAGAETLYLLERGPNLIGRRGRSLAEAATPLFLAAMAAS